MLLLAVTAHGQGLPELSYDSPTVLGVTGVQKNARITTSGDTLVFKNSDTDAKLGVATWQVHANGSCIVSVTLNIVANPRKTSQSGHRCTVTILDGSNPVGKVSEAQSGSWAASDISLGAIIIPSAGDYTIQLVDSMYYSSVYLTGVTLTAKEIPSTDFSAPLNCAAADAETVGEITKVGDSIKYNDKEGTKNGVASWPIKVTQACKVYATIHFVDNPRKDASHQSGHNCCVEILDANNNLVDSVKENPNGSWAHSDVSFTKVISIPAAGIYTIKLSNSMSWSTAYLTGVSLTPYYRISGDNLPGASWSAPATMTEVSENLYMAQFTLTGYQTFKPVINGSQYNYWADGVNSTLSDLTISQSDEIYKNFAFDVPGTSGEDYYVMDIFWDAAANKAYVKYDLEANAFVFTVAGHEDILGVAWDPTADANDMTDNGDGTFTLVKHNVNLSSGEYAYKVVADHSWNINFGDNGNDAVLAISDAGIYDITFSFDWNTKAVSASAQYIPQYMAIIGDMNGWDGSVNELVIAADKLTATATIHLDMNNNSGYGFKVLLDGKAYCIQPNPGWYAFHEENTSVSGINHEATTEEAFWLSMNMAGDYIFKWTVAEKKLEITFPQPIHTNGYYLMGNINGADATWTIADLTADRMLEVNPSNANEYMITTPLAEGDQLQVVRVYYDDIKDWYPGGENSNYLVDANHAGLKTIYCNIKREGGEGWHQGSIWIDANPENVYARGALTVDKWGTICLPKAVATVENSGAEFYQVSSVNASVVNVVSVDALEAGKPYLFKATGTYLTVTMSGDAVADPIANGGLIGNLNSTPIALNAASNAYILSNNEFHLLIEDATASVKQYRAYLQGSAIAAPSQLRIVEAENNTTDVKSVEANEKAVKFFENGQLRILRDGVVYDATGRVVR